MDLTFEVKTWNINSHINRWFIVNEYILFFETPENRVQTSENDVCVYGTRVYGTRIE